jgi:putative AdoMet-dependent methyltransferase
MPNKPDWFYNEWQQVGLDFEDQQQVSDYDTRQGSDPDAEQKLIEQLGIRPGQTLIDLGCGTGSFAIAAARHGAQVHAVDVSKTMLKHIERQCNHQNIQSVSLHHSGFLTYDHKGQADWIISRYAYAEGYFIGRSKCYETDAG